jgi:hypothetical protein
VDATAKYNPKTTTSDETAVNNVYKKVLPILRQQRALAAADEPPSAATSHVYTLPAERIFAFRVTPTPPLEKPQWQLSKAREPQREPLTDADASAVTCLCQLPRQHAEALSVIDFHATPHAPASPTDPELMPALLLLQAHAREAHAAHARGGPMHSFSYGDVQQCAAVVQSLDDAVVALRSSERAAVTGTQRCAGYGSAHLTWQTLNWGLRFGAEHLQACVAACHASQKTMNSVMWAASKAFVMVAGDQGVWQHLDNPKTRAMFP